MSSACSHGVWFKAFEPSEGCGCQGYWEVECLGGVGSAKYLDCDRVATNPVGWVLLVVVLGDAGWFEVLGVGLVGDVRGERGEVVTINGVVIFVRSVPSPCLNDARMSRSLLIFCLSSIMGAS
jgi:hypothetical protein